MVPLCLHTLVFAVALTLTTITLAQAEPGASAAVDPAEAVTSKVPMDHAHLPVAVPETVPAPALSLRLTADAMSGFNLHLALARYRLGPPPASATMQSLMNAKIEPGQTELTGHAHLYVNGQKIQRLYGTDVHLPASLFRPGTNEVTVTLNDHAHRYYSVAGTQVVATVFVDPEQEPAILYQYASFPVDAAPVTLAATASP